MSKAHVSGNTLTFSDGNVYEKQAESPKAAATAQLTIDQIILMAAAKLPDDVIIGTIRKSGSKFDLIPDALIKLKTAGVSDAVLRAMMQQSDWKNELSSCSDDLSRSRAQEKIVEKAKLPLVESESFEQLTTSSDNSARRKPVESVKLIFGAETQKRSLP